MGFQTDQIRWRVLIPGRSPGCVENSVLLRSRAIRGGQYSDGSQKVSNPLRPCDRGTDKRPNGVGDNVGSTRNSAWNVGLQYFDAEAEATSGQRRVKNRLRPGTRKRKIHAENHAQRHKSSDIQKDIVDVHSIQLKFLHRRGEHGFVRYSEM